MYVQMYVIDVIESINIKRRRGATEFVETALEAGAYVILGTYSIYNKR